MPPAASNLRRTASVAALVGILVVLAWWRGVCIASGPDVDTDAYAHHMIARAILADPSDLRIHWVWLPLFHYLQAALVYVGGTMNAVRFINCAIVFVTPLVLFQFVMSSERKAGAEPLAPFVALGAALVAGSDPIVMEMGTTGQPEPLFCLLILGVAIAFQRRAYLTTGVLLALAALIRYEAWAALVMVGAVVKLESLQRLRRGERPWLPGISTWVMVLLPIVAIVTWAAFRRPFDDGKWFAFLAQTREFANDATKAKSSFDLGPTQVALDVLRYPVIVPGRLMGAAVVLVPFGIVRTWRVQGSRFVLVFLACLGMVTLSWVTRGSLGLFRHFVVAVPLYATFAANGVLALLEWKRGAEERGAKRLARFTVVTVAVLSFGSLVPILTLWMRDVHASTVRGFPDRSRTGAFLRALPEKAPLFCDDATIEIISGIDRRRFDRHWLNDPPTWDIIDATAARDGEVYVATWAAKLKPFLSHGEIVFRASPDAPEGTGIVVMRVARPAR